ncbi:hypothetical protein KCU71_g2026, partial [Aureobasidium melanogenum]
MGYNATFFATRTIFICIVISISLTASKMSPPKSGQFTLPIRNSLNPTAQTFTRPPPPPPPPSAPSRPPPSPAE